MNLYMVVPRLLVEQGVRDETWDGSSLDYS